MLLQTSHQSVQLILHVPANHYVCLTVITTNRAYLSPTPLSYWLLSHIASAASFQTVQLHSILSSQYDQFRRRARSPSHKSKRPNFFFALQVSQSASVTAAIMSIHDSLVQHSKDLQAALVEPETAHLTVMVTALDSKQEIQHAEAAMESFTEQLAANGAWTKPLALTLEGLSHFRHQVQQAGRVLQLLSALLPTLQMVQWAPHQLLLGLWLQTKYTSP